MDRIRGGPRAILAVATLALASCSTQRPVPRPAPVATPRASPVVRTVGPGEFVASAASIDLFVVRACELALVRSTDERIRALASALRDGHRGLAAQLSMAGRRLDALPAARLDAREEARLGELQAAAEFDGAFLRQMKAVHRRSLALHSAFAARGSSPTLRPVGANGAFVERRHSAMLGAL